MRVACASVGVLSHARLLSPARLLCPWNFPGKNTGVVLKKKKRILGGLPFPPPGDLPDPRTDSTSPALQADSSLLNHLGSLRYVLVSIHSRKRCLNKIIDKKKFNTSWNVSITYKILHYLKYIHQCVLGAMWHAKCLYMDLLFNPPIVNEINVIFILHIRKL